MTIEARDFLGNRLSVGDGVVFMQLGYRNLVKGIIVSISKKMLTITHKKQNIGGTETRQFHDQVVKIFKEGI